MIRAMWTSTLLNSLLAFSLTTPPAQDDEGPGPPPSLGGSAPTEQEPLLAEDGKPAEAGRIPEGTSPEAIATWDKLVTATRADLAPIHSFDLRFEVITKAEGSTNRLPVGITYLENDHARSPFIRLFLKRPDLLSIHGPTGNWMMDGDTIQAMSGREFKDDLQNLAEYRTLSRNLLGLIQPGRLRIVSARRLTAHAEPDTQVHPERCLVFDGAAPADTGNDRGSAARPVRLPTAKMAAAAKQLEWIELRSPDLRVHHSGPMNEGEVYRARLGLDPASGEVKLALLHAETARGGVDIARSLLVEVSSYREISGYRLPKVFTVKEPDRNSMYMEFPDREGTMLGLLKESSVNLKLTEAHFTPKQN